VTSIAPLIYKHLAGADWVPGLALLRRVAREIPPGPAARWWQTERIRKGSNVTPIPMEEMIRRGRDQMVQHSLAALVRRGRIEVDVPKLTVEHWTGREPWHVRDPASNHLSVTEAADMLGLTRNQLWHWIRLGHVPDVEVVGGRQMVRREDMDVYRRVRQIWPGVGRRWRYDPRSVWNDEATQPMPVTALTSCPHCGQAITLTLEKQPTERTPDDEIPGSGPGS
jgi:hypothetical protein